MTLGAFESSLDMDFMDELDMVGKSVNTFPIDGLFIIPGCGKFLDLWFVFASYFMTEHALFHSGDARRGFLGYVSVAEGAVESQLLDVDRVREGYGLSGALGIAEDDGLSQPRGYDEGDNQDHAHEAGEPQESEESEQDQPDLGLGRAPRPVRLRGER